MYRVALDATPVDTMHKSRGIGRYAQGLIQGFTEIDGLEPASPISLCFLRQPHSESLAVPESSIPDHTLGRALKKGIIRMWTENMLRMDAMLPPDIDLYHATSMEGTCRRAMWVPTCHDIIPMLMPGDYLAGVKKRPRVAWWDTYVEAMRTRATRVVAISHHVKQTLVDVGLDAERVDVIHHGLAPFWSRRDDPRAPAPHVRAQRHDPYLIFIGGYDSRKNFDGLATALSLIPASRRPRLVAVGGRDPVDAASTDAIVKKLGLDVTFLGRVDDIALRWLYRHSLGLVFPSLEEGWGFPIVEAMAAGAPVVCADFGSMVESGGGAAITCDVREEDALAHAIMNMVEDEALRAHHIELGAARVKELTWASCAREMMRVWERALDC